MNRVYLFGNVGKDPEVKKLESGKSVAKFSLATSKSHKEGDEWISVATWHNIVAWDWLAEKAERSVKKGTPLTIEGSIRYGSYEDKDGVTKYTTDIIASAIHFAEKREKTDDNQGKYQKGDKVDMKAISDVDELPGNVATDEENESPF